MENLLLRPAVLKRAALSTSSLYREMSAGRFPRPVHVLRNRVAWRADEVDSWVADRIAERDAAVAETSARWRRASPLMAAPSVDVSAVE